jgi:hypothetical protein
VNFNKHWSWQYVLGFFFGLTLFSFFVDNMFCYHIWTAMSQCEEKILQNKKVFFLFVGEKSRLLKVKTVLAQ